MNFQETVEYFNGVITKAQTLLCLSSSSSLQVEQCRALDALQYNAFRFKNAAISRSDEDESNFFLGYECVIGALRSELLTYILLKRDMPNEAWDQLISAQIGCLDASRAHKSFDQCHQRIEQLITYENLFFPKQNFMSAGFVSDRLECSICGKTYAKCPHLKGNPYMGVFCEIIHRNPVGHHVALVDSPDDKRCRVTSIQIKEGHQDRNSGEITPYKDNELYIEDGTLNVTSILMAINRFPYLAATDDVLGESGALA